MQPDLLGHVQNWISQLRYELMMERRQETKQNLCVSAGSADVTVVDEKQFTGALASME